jgi:hypothetical protein
MHCSTLSSFVLKQYQAVPLIYPTNSTWHDKDLYTFMTSDFLSSSSPNNNLQQTPPSTTKHQHDEPTTA